MNSIETRVTDWFECKDGPWYPTMKNGGLVAYRIWQQFDGMRWFQRHEWKAADGSIDIQEWINGAKDWCPSAHPVQLNA